MKDSTFVLAYRAFMTRRPFRTFFIEFASGGNIPVVHPEIIRFRDDVIVYQHPSRVFHLFDVTSVIRLHDAPPRQG